MKTLADMICAERYEPGTPEFAVQKALRLPSPNHTPGPVQQPALDRFVFGRPESEALFALAARLPFPDSNHRVVAPLKDFWMELALSGVRYGFSYASAGDNAIVLVFLSTERGASLQLFGTFSVHAGIIGRQAFVAKSSGVSRDDGLRDYVHTVRQLFAAALTSLTQSRMAVTRKTHRYEGHKDIAKAATKAAQRGRPVYSHNLVEFTFLKTSIQRGEIDAVTGLGEKRGHWVIGHWRWIDANTAEPHWTWVIPHKRGNDARGFVTKTRRVKGPLPSPDRMPAPKKEK